MAFAIVLGLVFFSVQVYHVRRKPGTQTCAPSARAPPRCGPDLERLACGSRVAECVL